MASGWLPRSYSNGSDAASQSSGCRFRRMAHELLCAAVDNGIRGGALYDALIGATAAHHGCRLVSADRRAAPVYAAVGADVVVVEAA